GTHTVTATYLSDGNYAGSLGGLTGGQLVTTQFGTVSTTTVSSSVNPSTPGQGVTFTVAVKGTSGFSSPSGTVTFYDGFQSIGQGTLTGASGMSMASFTTSTL